MRSTLTAHASLFYGVAAIACVAVATASPFAVAALGLALFGLLHITLELRYVIGRFSDILRGPFAWWLLGLTTATMVTRGLTGVLPGTRQIEISLGVAIVAVGVVKVARTRPSALAVALVALAALLVAAVLWPRGYFFVLTHLHNFIPVAFLWDWSRRLPTPRRRVFMTVQFGWALLLPAVILAGAADAARGASPSWLSPLIGDGQGLIAAAAPVGADAGLGWRYLVAFAFMQTMHYVTWIVFLPAAAPDVSRAFDARFPALRGRRLWAAGLGVSAVLLVVFLLSYPFGRALYSLLASYHIYIELPLLVVLFAGVVSGGPRSGVVSTDPRDCRRGGSTTEGQVVSLRDELDHRIGSPRSLPNAQ